MLGKARSIFFFTIKVAGRILSQQATDFINRLNIEQCPKWPE